MDTLFVPDLAPAVKHSSVFQKFDALQPGESFLFVNDRDPGPLYFEMKAKRGGGFQWKNIESGPEFWKVEIKKSPKDATPSSVPLHDTVVPTTKIDRKSDETIGEIVAKNIRNAEVFKKYGIDFCCGGKKTLKQACQDAGVDNAFLEAELAQAGLADITTSGHDFGRWQPDFLADYIYNQHHLYYYEAEPVITDMLTKVVARHGTEHPELFALQVVYKQLVNELRTHFAKEERVVFPFVKALVKTKVSGDFKALATQPSLTEPVRLMEEEHEAAGGLLGQMQELTKQYTVPEGACNSYVFLFAKLKELDDDLHQHIHLENNLLFPKALLLEKEISA